MEIRKRNSLLLALSLSIHPSVRLLSLYLPVSLSVFLSVCSFSFDNLSLYLFTSIYFFDSPLFSSLLLSVSQQPLLYDMRDKKGKQVKLSLCLIN
jgi:hypothetical protein